MRIKELLNESAESIETYLILQGIDIHVLENTVNDIFKMNDINPIIKSKLVSIFSICSELCFKNELWERFNDDPGVEEVFNRIAILGNNIYDFLENIDK